MPLAVAHFRQRPAPLGRLELLHVDVGTVLLSQEQHELAVVDVQRVVVAVLHCNEHIGIQFHSCLLRSENSCSFRSISLMEMETQRV